jgi:membrane fusion protein, multidrug efflux system
MKKLPGWLLAAIIIASLIASKYVFFPKKDEKSAMGKPKEEKPTPVNFVIAQKQSINEQVYSSGRVGAFNQVEIKPEIGGKITGLYVQEGSEVKKGTLLVKLNDADFQAQLAKNKISQKQAEQKLDRLKKLLQVNGVSQEEYEIQENELEMLKADQAFIMAQIQKTNVTAPFDGVIGLKQISEGEMVNSNQILFNLIQLNSVFVEFSVPEKYTSYIKKGSEVSFETDKKTSDTYTATVYATEPKIDEASQSLKIRAQYKGNKEILPGSFVKVYSRLNDGNSHIMLPTNCIVPVLKGQKIYVIKEGKAIGVNVLTGLRSDNTIQILEGIQEGDSVITSGLMALKDGAMVKPLQNKNR